ncbi:MAG TPA: MTAP family purine nucleoside phosphorylase [Sphaerochaeta sp.]|nr:MTAP family purine nucleoside phosphorylase [Sphaerochaeta sp.]
MRAIIGGTGFDSLDAITTESRTVTTPYGSVELFESSDGLIFLPRHGADHRYPPHAIPYRAQIEALHQRGVKEVVAIYAVGSISDRLPPEAVGLVGDFVDFSGQVHTFSTEGEVLHTAVDAPFSTALQERALAHNPDLTKDLLYVSTAGPRLETKAEIAFFARQGFDVVGMTLAAEATLLAERNIPTVALTYSINWAAGIGADRLSFISDETIAARKAEITTLSLGILGY